MTTTTNKINYLLGYLSYAKNRRQLAADRVRHGNEEWKKELKMWENEIKGIQKAIINEVAK